MSTTQTQTRFIYLFRFPAGASPKPSSPEEMQAQYAAWSAWKSKFEKEVTPGEGLKGGGAVVKGGDVTDGPFIEAKEVMGSYAFVATSIARQGDRNRQGMPDQPDPRRQRGNSRAGVLRP